jgi:hypothetical protein
MGAYIGGGEPPARPMDGMPLQWAGCPRGRVKSLFVNKKIFYSRRGSREGALEKDLAPPAHWIGGRCPAPRLPPIGRAEGTSF